MADDIDGVVRLVDDIFHQLPQDEVFQLCIPLVCVVCVSYLLLLAQVDANTN